MPRIRVGESLKREVLSEAGYRCAVPTCRNILAIDLHHIVEVEDNGSNSLSNLIALCPTCHALYSRGIISREAIRSWKIMLVSLNHAFDKESISNLLFLKNLPPNKLVVSGDGVLKFSHLIGSGLAGFEIKIKNGPIVVYQIFLTEKGKRIVDAWFSGNRDQVRIALGDIVE